MKSVDIYTWRSKCSIDKAPYCCDDGWCLIFAGSRFTTPAESRYAPVEGGALAICYGLKKWCMFIMGCKDLLVATDHTPLVKNLILENGNLANISNPLLFNIKERTLRHSYEIKHIRGAGHHAPYAFSRRHHTRHS